MPYQQDVLNKLKKSNAVLVYHGLGSGKTATSIAATEGQPTDVVVPASLRGNYQKEIKKWTSKEHNRDIISYNKFVKDVPSGHKTLVLDEPQKIGRTSSQMSQSIVRAAKRYDKRILLTGTPASNNPAELAPIIRTLTPEAHIPLNPTEFNKRFIGEKPVRLSPWQYMKGMQPGVEYYPKHTQEIESAIKGKVSYYNPPKTDYPSRIDIVKKIPASKEQVGYYNFVTRHANPILAMKIRKNLPLSKQESTQLNAFMTGARQVSNTTIPYGGKEVLSPKLKSVVEDFSESYKKNPEHKGIIYSNYLAGGLNEISNEFAKRGIPHAKFTGELNDVQRKAAVSDYNTGKVKALLVSSSGSQGLDLKGTRSIQIMEPHWNKTRVEQVIGRGIRYKSHTELPPEQRNVTVIKYQTTLPKTFGQKITFHKPSTSADEYLENLSNKKQETLDRFLDIFKHEGMSKQSFLKEVAQNAFNDELEKISSISKKVIGIIKKNPEASGAIIGATIGAFKPTPKGYVRKEEGEDKEDYAERLLFAKENARMRHWQKFPERVFGNAILGAGIGFGVRQFSK